MKTTNKMLVDALNSQIQSNNNLITNIGDKLSKKFVKQLNDTSDAMKKLVDAMDYNSEMPHIEHAVLGKLIMDKIKKITNDEF